MVIQPQYQLHDSHPKAPAAPADLAGAIARRFTLLVNTTTGLVSLAQRLRYQVYCIEHSFEDPSSFPDGLECDEFDANSLHGLLVDQRHMSIAGTVRLILPSPAAPGASLPIQRLSRHPLPHDRQLLTRGAAEISRFAISKEYRWSVRASRSREESGPPVPDEGREPLIAGAVLALIKGVVQMSTEHGITELFAIMEPALLRLLSRFGIHFTPLGPLVEYHGRRQPCHTNLPALLRRLQEERPDVWKVLSVNSARFGAA